MPRSKEMFVRNVRIADAKDIEKIETTEARVPIYSIEVMHKVKDFDADSIGKSMATFKARNIVEREKVKDGFVSIFELTNKATVEFTDFGGQTVTVLATLDGQKATFEGQIIGRAGYVVFVQIEGGTVVMCPIQSSNCWLFA